MRSSSTYNIPLKDQKWHEWIGVRRPIKCITFYCIIVCHVTVTSIVLPSTPFLSLYSGTSLQRTPSGRRKSFRYIEVNSEDFLRIGSKIVIAMARCPLWRGVRYGEVSAMARCPLWRGVRYGEVSAMARCPLWRGVRYGEVSAMARCPLWRGVRYGEVSAMARGLTVNTNLLLVSDRNDFGKG